MKVRIPSHPAHIVVFLLLAFLCYQAHQLARHLVGAALCGGFVSMTFAVTTTREPCSFPTLVTLAGPLLTYGLAWFGMFLLRSSEYRLFAYDLIFASFAHLRFIQTLTGRGDELILAEQWFGVTSQSLVAAIVFLIGLPPVLVAFRAIVNKSHLLVFIGSWLLPLPLLFAMLIGNNLLFGADTGEGASLFGIPLIVFMTDLIVSVIFMMLAPRYFHQQAEA